MTEPYQILVAGSGVMGRGIALSFARTGHRTAVLSRNPAGVAEIGEPNEVVQAKHREGRLGIKTGTGFYDWRAMDVPAYQKASAALLARVLDALEGRRPSPPPLSRDDDG